MGHGCSWAWESLLPSSNSLHAFLELFSSVHPNHNLPSVCSQRHQQKPVSKMRFGSLPSKHSRRADMEVLLLFVSLLQGESPENSAGTKGSCWRFAASHHYGAGAGGPVPVAPHLGWGRFPIHRSVHISDECTSSLLPQRVSLEHLVWAQVFDRRSWRVHHPPVLLLHHACQQVRQKVLV